MYAGRPFLSRRLATTYEKYLELWERKLEPEKVSKELHAATEEMKTRKAEIEWTGDWTGLKKWQEKVRDLEKQQKKTDASAREAKKILENLEQKNQLLYSEVKDGWERRTMSSVAPSEPAEMTQEAANQLMLDHFIFSKQHESRLIKPQFSLLEKVDVGNGDWVTYNPSGHGHHLRPVAGADELRRLMRPHVYSKARTENPNASEKELLKITAVLIEERVESFESRDDGYNFY
eukprot:TRINITY_DN655_c8_g1_i1.p1 TRINITY_DN655_c8_g1~~TRINITY_DN655_c8_g1_i1.p1  ORF type:complete len:252 (+),score=42.11 TRINITY_DN655_c8_g1_i1:58-756(+)